MPTRKLHPSRLAYQSSSSSSFPKQESSYSAMAIILFVFGIVYGDGESKMCYVMVEQSHGAIYVRRPMRLTGLCDLILCAPAGCCLRYINTQVAGIWRTETPSGMAVCELPEM